MRIACMIATLRLFGYCRRSVRWLGLHLKKQGTRLERFGEEEEENRWSREVFARLPFALLEINEHFPKVGRGVISTAFLLCADRGFEKKVVLRLNWIATRQEFFDPPSNDPWSYGGSFDVIIDPAASPLHELPDGTLWFMWPFGGMGVISGVRGSETKKRLRFEGDPETPRVYTYF